MRGREVLISVAPRKGLVLVFTVLAVEHQAVREQLGRNKRRETVSGITYEVGNLRHTTAEIAVGNVPLSTRVLEEVAAPAIDHFQPAGVILVGVGASPEATTHLELGDVVISPNVYSFGARSTGRVPDVAGLDIFAFGRMALLAAKEPGRGQRLFGSALLLHRARQAGTTGEMAADDIPKIRRLLDYHFRAVVGKNPTDGSRDNVRSSSLPFLFVRGVSDFGDNKDKDSAASSALERFVAVNAATVARDVAVELLRLRGNREPTRTHSDDQEQTPATKAWATPVVLLDFEGDDVLAEVPAWDRTTKFRVATSRVPEMALAALRADRKPVHGIAMVNLGAPEQDDVRIEDFVIAEVPTDDSLGMASDA